ncbi:MAG: hypothetical protein PHW95_01260 [Patescibacteria group bacterium]|nr:hypothetical protein [Patescibacteria group bacterium]
MLKSFLARAGLGRKQKPKQYPRLMSHAGGGPTRLILTPLQLNTSNVMGLHSRIHGDFSGLSGDVSGLVGNVSAELFGNASGIWGRVDHLSGDIRILASQGENPVQYG